MLENIALLTQAARFSKATEEIKKAVEVIKKATHGWSPHNIERNIQIAVAGAKEGGKSGGSVCVRVYL
jgi:hypothetical protein